MYKIKVSSITNAQRAVKLLKIKNIKAEIGRINNPAKGDGCGYTVNLNTNILGNVTDYLKANGIRITGVDEV